MKKELPYKIHDRRNGVNYHDKFEQIISKHNEKEKVQGAARSWKKKITA